MKSEEDVQKERDRLFRLFMDSTKKKPLRDEAFIKFKALSYVLEDEEDIVEKRLREINVTGNKTPNTK